MTGDRIQIDLDSLAKLVGSLYLQGITPDQLAQGKNLMGQLLASSESLPIRATPATRPPPKPDTPNATPRPATRLRNSLQMRQIRRRRRPSQTRWHRWCSRFRR